MTRIIFVPQFPSKLRYQEFFFTEFKKQFEKHFDEVIVLGESYVSMIGSMEARSDIGLFSSLSHSINMESNQINEYMNLNITKDDFLFLSDLSYPGFFSNILYHKPIKNAFGYLHASSKNKYDIFASVRYSKFPCETAHSKLFKKVFIGSEYHKNKLGWKNTKVIGLPTPPFKTFKSEKKYDIISVCRPNKQKITKSIEDCVERDFGKIVRKEFNYWEQYYKFLSEGNVLLITSKEDTFNYTVLESVMNGTVVLAPNRCAFPELLEKDYLYSNYDELRTKIWQVLNGQLLPPEKLKNQNLVDNFYENLINEMKG